MKYKNINAADKALFVIRILRSTGGYLLHSQGGETLYDILASSGSRIDAPCGGMHLCGKCKIRIVEPSPAPPFPEEIKLLSEAELSSGVRLACMCHISGDMTIELPDDISGSDLSPSCKGSLLSVTNSHGEDKAFPGETSGFDSSTILPYSKKSLVRSTRVFPDTPSLSDQRSFCKRLYKAISADISADICSACNTTWDVDAILSTAECSAQIMAGGFLDVVHTDDRILLVREDTDAPLYGMAIDIGTTTVAVYLVDMRTGKVKSSVSAMNSQKAYGADVISRISYASSGKEGALILKDIISVQLDNMARELAATEGISAEDIFAAVITGNTTMLHLLTGADPSAISVSPYIPVFTEAIHTTPSSLGIGIRRNGLALMLPSISSYVGADIVAGMLACGMDQSDNINLLIDIGTNGEIAIGSKKGFLCCSAAAGPAFEGAGISHGLGGVKGAINSVRHDAGSKCGISYTTIGNAAPTGICGAGVIDAISVLLSAGIIEASGAFCKPDEVCSRLRPFMIETPNSGMAFELAKNPYGVSIIITQKDIREIQLAKAAIAAGIKVLMKKAGISPDEIRNVFISGGFGNYLDKDNAIKTGLIPSALSGRIVTAGNTAGSGAVMCLTDSRAPERCNEIAAKSEYLELSSSQNFRDEFPECMFFGEL